MANKEHVTVTDPNIHEPKGASTAAAGEIYVADGGGSGVWTPQTSLDSFTGWARYDDSQYTSASPLALSAGVRTKLTIDGVLQTIEDQLPLDAAGASLWDTTTSKITPIQEDDAYESRLAFDVDPSGSGNTYIDIEIDVGGGVGTILTRTIALAKGGSPQQAVWSVPLFVGSTFITNGAEIYVTGGVNMDIYDITISLFRIHKGR